MKLFYGSFCGNFSAVMDGTANGVDEDENNESGPVETSPKTKKNLLLAADTELNVRSVPAEELKTQTAIEESNSHAIQTLLPSPTNGSDQTKKRTSSASLLPDREDDPVDFQIRSPLEVSRDNLVTVVRLAVRELLDWSVKVTRTFNTETILLQNLFIIMEQILYHGLRQKKALLLRSDSKYDAWTFLMELEKDCKWVKDLISSAQGLGASTQLGCVRGLLRIATMRKQLSELFREIAEQRTLAERFYHENAVLCSDDLVMISGLLVGLNVLDCNLYLKGEELDGPPKTVDYGRFLKRYVPADDVEPPKSAIPADSDKLQQEIHNLQDQKSYLEELNACTSNRLSDSLRRVEELETSQTLLKSALADANNKLLNLQEGLTVLERQNESLRARLPPDQRRSVGPDDDLALQSNPLEQEVESKRRELNEVRTAMQLLERDVHEKQDMIMSLRKQLDQVKQINVDLYRKFQNSETSLEHKTMLVARLESKLAETQNELQQVKTTSDTASNDRDAMEETTRALSHQLAERDSQKQLVETDLKIEREWRESLQASLEKERAAKDRLSRELEFLKPFKDYSERLEGETQELRQRCADQEEALKEMGSHLSDSFLKMDSLKESSQTLNNTWLRDNQATHCGLCNKEFSLVRRKHHCRQCGKIFCNDCSDSKVFLSSSSKPVRVCDTCYERLLERSSLSTT